MCDHINLFKTSRWPIDRATSESISYFTKTTFHKIRLSHGSAERFTQDISRNSYKEQIALEKNIGTDWIDSVSKKTYK